MILRTCSLSDHPTNIWTLSLDLKGLGLIRERVWLWNDWTQLMIWSMWLAMWVDHSECLYRLEGETRTRILCLPILWILRCSQPSNLFLMTSWYSQAEDGLLKFKEDLRASREVSSRNSQWMMKILLKSMMMGNYMESIKDTHT